MNLFRLFHIQNRDRYVPILLAVVTCAGAFLRWYQIADQSLWLDEAFSLWVSRHDPAEMLSWIVRIDQHPPLYYLLLHFWMRLGDRPGQIRALSALVGTLNIPVLYLLGQRLVDRTVGLMAALILAFSPFHIRFAQEARMYTLLSLNASLAMAALVYALTRSGNKRPTARTGLAWAAFALSTAATMLTHHTALLFPLATNLFVLWLAWYHRQKPDTSLPSIPLRTWIVAQLCLLLLWSPWLKPFVVQASGVYHEFWVPAPTWQRVGEALHNLLSAFLPLRLDCIVLIWAVALVLLFLGSSRLQRQPAHLALLWILFATPFAGELLVSLWRPVFYVPTLIWASIPFYLLLATGLRQLRPRFYLLAATAFLLAMNIWSLREYWQHFQKEQWDDAATYVAEQIETGDLLLFHATWVQLPFDYYFQPEGKLVEERGVPVDLFGRGILEPKMTHGDLPRLYALIRGRDRVWLIYSHDWYTDPHQQIPAALEETFDLLERQPFHGLEVRLYGMRDASLRSERQIRDPS